MSELLPNHRALLDASGISPALACSRGYRSVTTKAELISLGFKPNQARIPALLLPLYNPLGELAGYQIRPDIPRIGSSGKPVKYEMPQDSVMVLDVPPLAQDWIRDPKRPLVVTEGVRKADAAVSLELTCIALLGVWNWRGRNEYGGTAALAAWEYIPLNGRRVLIAFDSDVMQRRQVHGALARLKSFLESRGAEVLVVYLPTGKDGAKVGLDDYLAAGHTAVELLALAAPELRPLPKEDDETPCPYRESPSGLTWMKPTVNGAVEMSLANFSAKITSDVLQDDGLETIHVFEVEARRRNRVERFDVAAREFASMGWIMERMGAEAVVYPGFSIREHLRTAVQMLSGSIDRRTIYTHFGWRFLDGEWFFLHAGGAIGSTGARSDIEVRPPRSLERYRLPAVPTPSEAVEAIRRSLEFIQIGAPLQTWPILASAFAAVLAEFLHIDFVVWVYGPTGQRKSTVAALLLCFFGPFVRHHLPANFSSTGNALELLAFAAKDLLLVIDDYAPPPDSRTAAQQDATAHRLLRAIGDSRGRNRATADARLRGEKPPRCLPLVTAEMPPPGSQSSEARTLEVEWAAGGVDLARLTHAQREDAPQYAVAMAGFLAWIAPRIERLRGWLEPQIRTTADAFPGDHGRVRESAAKLLLGLRLFMDYAVEMGAIDDFERNLLLNEAAAALTFCAERTGRFQAERRPTALFLEYLGVLVTQKRAYLCDSKTGEPPHPGPLRYGFTTVDTAEATVYKPQSIADKIGWVDENEGLIYLIPAAAHHAVTRYAQGANVRFPVTQRALGDHLKRERLLVRYENDRTTAVVRLESGLQRVWILSLTTLFPDSGNNGNGGNNDHDDPPPSSPVASSLAAAAVLGAAWPPAAASSELLPPGGSSDPAVTDATGSASIINHGSSNSPVIISNPAELRRAMESLESTQIIAVDLETSGLNPRRDQIRLISLSTDRGTWVVDAAKVDPRPLLPLLAGRRLVAHNAVFDLSFLGTLDFEPGEVEDTMLLSQLLRAGTGARHSLADVVKNELGVDLPKDLQRSDWTGPLTHAQIDYAARDSAVLLLLLDRLRDQVREAGLERAAEIERRCLPAVVWMTSAGVPFDRHGWAGLADESNSEGASLEAELNERVSRPPGLDLGVGWNWNSSTDALRALREAGCELANTSDEALAAVDHPLAALLQRFRGVKKLSSSYGAGWFDHLAEGRIHPSWKQIGAASGRMSCHSPNIQQIPRDPRYRACVAAPEGEFLVRADYSQIELRIVAKVADEKTMTAAYEREEDLHVLTAQRLTEKSVVSKEERQLAKAVNFGLVYGMGVEGFRKYARSQYGVDLSPVEAARYRRAFFTAYPGLAAWHRQVRRARSLETRTITGRRRLLPDDTPDTQRLNSPVQGTGADGLKRALSLLWERRQECPGAVPILACHDEIVLLCHEGSVDAASEWLRRAMFDGIAPLLDPVPVQVDVRSGTTWAG